MQKIIVIILGITQNKMLHKISIRIMWANAENNSNNINIRYNKILRMISVRLMWGTAENNTNNIRKKE